MGQASRFLNLYIDGISVCSYPLSLDSCRVEEVDHPLGLWEAAVAEILLPATQRAVTCTEIVYNMIR
jgi:hypothetical protein